MSEHKKSLNPWVPVVLMGVVTILFGAYAVQSQTDLLEAKKECEQLKTQVTECAMTSQQQLKEVNLKLEQAMIDVQVAKAFAEQTVRDCSKVNKRK
jgi:hypothetical protein